MNATLEKGLQEIRHEAKLEGYRQAIADAEREVHEQMNESDGEARTALWGVMGGLGRLRAEAMTRALDMQTKGNSGG